MSNIYHLKGTPEPAKPAHTRGPYRKTATKSAIQRAVRAAAELGFTVYGVTIEGETIHIQTRQGPERADASASAADAWFDRRG